MQSRDRNGKPSCFRGGTGKGPAKDTIKEKTVDWKVWKKKGKERADAAKLAKVLAPPPPRSKKKKRGGKYSRPERGVRPKSHGKQT